MTLRATLSIGLKLVALLPALLVGLPLQALAVRLDHPLAAGLPLWFHRYACRILGVRLRMVGHPPPQGPALLVSNHVSWLDILVLGAAAPLSFVAKAEVADWPLFGLLARLQRTVFVDRTRRTATAAAAGGIAERLALGGTMVLFAEGTTSDGNRVLPYRSALIGAAHLEDLAMPVPVIPVALVYAALDGLPLGRRERPRIAWYGDMELLPHLAGIFAGAAVDVTVHWGEPMAGADKSARKDIARRAERHARTSLALAPFEIASKAP